MNLQETLTKENFWNEIYSTYPKACKLFCDWIDEYKKACNWDMLFFNNRKASPQSKCRSGNIKFHSIPHAMQQGIWIEFVQQTLHQYFEQPEYEYSMDLEEDIKTVFGELEKEIQID